ncbi:MAG: RNase adapter RapZ [Polyangiales bacterium]
MGCTGGQHRSVSIVEELARRLGKDRKVTVQHRDIRRDGRGSTVG